MKELDIMKSMTKKEFMNTLWVDKTIFLGNERGNIVSVRAKAGTDIEVILVFEGEESTFSGENLWALYMDCSLNMDVNVSFVGFADKE